jgi:hypothetical protein
MTQIWNKVKRRNLPPKGVAVLIHLSGSLIVARLNRQVWVNDWDDSAIARVSDNLVTEWSHLPLLPDSVCVPDVDPEVEKLRAELENQREATHEWAETYELAKKELDELRAKLKRVEDRTRRWKLKALRAREKVERVRSVVETGSINGWLGYHQAISQVKKALGGK